MRRTYRLVGLCAVAGGCAVGTTAATHELARSPAGVALTGPGGQVVGELVAVEDTAIIVKLTNGTYAIGPYRTLPALRGAGLSRAYRFGGQGQAPGVATRRLLAAASRFPQGLRPDWAATLLAGAGQSGFGLLVSAGEPSDAPQPRP